MGAVKIIGLYLVLAVVSLYAPTAIKQQMFGSASLDTQIFTALIFGPSAFLLLGLYFGSRVLVAHTLLFIFSNFIALIIWLASGDEPNADLGRIYLLLLAGSYLLGLIFNLAITRRSKLI